MLLVYILNVSKQVSKYVCIAHYKQKLLGAAV